MNHLQYEIEQTMEQTEMIRHFKNLFGYTRESVTRAISEIREDAGDNPTGIQLQLLQRADEMARSLEYIEDRLG